MQTLEYLKESVASKNLDQGIKAGGLQGHNNLNDKFHIDDFNLRQRREFLRLGEEEKAIMIELIPWAKTNGPRIIKDLYDWQFSFPNTTAIFDDMSAARSIRTTELRKQLESTHTAYFTGCFTGAREDWGLEYFESRLHMGTKNDQHNMPFKWFVGSYAELLSLTLQQLKKSYDDEDFIEKAQSIITRVFLLDIQAVGDASLLNTVDALGIDLGGIETVQDTDLTDHLGQIRNEMSITQQQNDDYEGQLNAINQSFAVIEFELDGTIRHANINFLNTLGYSLEEVQGQHHRMFVSPEEAYSAAYKDFWDALGEGKYQAGEFMRLDKKGNEVWIQASYNPVLDQNGDPFKIVKYASEITEQVTMRSYFKSQLEAINKSQAVIEFELDGTIITANENFLKTLGYSLEEIQRKHHRMFVTPAHAKSARYKNFWELLGRGEYQSGEFMRVAKDGSERWIQASYNPVFNPQGQPVKVVKYATDVTETVLARANFQGQLDAIHKSQAVIEFELDGTIITANDNFLNTLGYSLREVQGQHHSMFATPELANSAEYKAFWEQLGYGEYQSGEFMRVAKDGSNVWIQASYNPIYNPQGQPYKVVKYATDITEQVTSRANFEGQLDAIHKSQAVIEFELDGTILTANDNFLNTLGYSLGEVQGQHHSMFATSEFAASAEYKAFWARLGRGEYQSGEFMRVAKDGAEVWIQASYNPIYNPEGEAYKVVKYATDITEQVMARANFEGQLEAIHKSQAVIEFELDGTIITANDNFLQALGYTLNEVQGKHHRIFVDRAYAQSQEYKDFWASLNQGRYQSGEFKRFGSSGNEVWIQASYNPIYDPNGKPIKVVKYASDVTAAVQSKIHLKESVDSMLEVVDAASRGDLSIAVGVSGEDAIGKMGEGLQRFIENLKETIIKIDDSAQMLTSASEQLSAVSETMGGSATETSSQANLVAAAAEQVSSNIQTVAAGAEEMTASIKSVASSAGEASRVANEAVQAAEQTNQTVSKLGESSTEIGKVIKVITSIAQQTNLLALNATIEAARAGEAGKGFAVVANEVKELAKQTAQATEEISQKIEAIQTDTQGAVQAISHISSIIGQINEFQGTIATAVEEQSSTTSEIARNVHEAAKGSAEIAENITKVAMAAESTSSGASDTSSATMELTKMANTLQNIVAQFKY
ncbi:MAG: PAS domain-containing protein [Bacteroidota bacterium]